MRETYKQNCKLIGNYVDEKNNLKFYEDYMDMTSVNDVEIDPKNLKIDYVLRSTIIFRNKKDFNKYMKYHKKMFELNGFKETK